MKTEIQLLREELAKLRERVAVLEAQPIARALPVFGLPLYATPGMRWASGVDG